MEIDFINDNMFVEPFKQNKKVNYKIIYDSLFLDEERKLVVQMLVCLILIFIFLVAV